jgi:adenylate cyclase
MERRLSAILSADIVGYSRLMGANEVGTLDALNNRRATILEPVVAAHNGRIFKLTGDGVLAEFGSAVSAIESAIAIQHDLQGRNANVPEDRRIEMRIGINLGEIIAQDGDIYGDGVNLAARIEGVARPGRIAVSEAVREQVGNRLEIEFEDLGEFELKNINRLVRIFEVLERQETARVGSTQSPRVEERPSIAVLPFNNLSGDAEQDFFSEGITEDIITDLSKVSGLFVIGRHTSFAYGGKSENLERIAKELGVQYLLEGSVRKAGNRLRVTGQLIEGATGGHLWAERYDRDLTDIFEIQDEITRTIVDQLKVRIIPTEKRVIARAPTSNVDAYTYYLQARQYYHLSSKHYLQLARELFSKAVQIDPSFARAYAGIANCDARLTGWYGLQIPYDEILALADKALELDPNQAEAHAARGYALGIADRIEEAEAAFDEALRLDPASFEANFAFARHCVKVGDYERAATLFIRSLEVQPDDPQAPNLLPATLRALGRDDEAREYARMGVKRAEEALRRFPDSARAAQLAAGSLVVLSRHGEAKEWLTRAMALEPDDSQAMYNGACMWAQLNDFGRAMDLLEKYVTTVGREPLVWLSHDPDLDPLKGYARFEALLATIQNRLSEEI